MLIRRKRRGTRSRRSIVTSNDLEPQKTHRTGFAAPPEQELTDEQYTGMGYDNGMSHFSTQRKSAIKARMNIAAEAQQDAALENI